MKVAKIVDDNCEFEPVKGYHTFYTAMRDKYRDKFRNDDFEVMWEKMLESKNEVEIATQILDIFTDNSDEQVKDLIDKGLICQD